MQKVDKKLVELEEKVEERTNQQLRETIAIKGVPEEQDETWEGTTQILSQIFNESMVF